MCIFFKKLTILKEISLGMICIPYNYFYYFFYFKGSISKSKYFLHSSIEYCGFCISYSSESDSPSS